MSARVSAPETTADTVTPEEFAQLFRSHPAGVAIITANDGSGRPVGFTASSVISVSAAPAILAFSMSVGSSCWEVVRQAEALRVHFLDSSHETLARQFATPGIDRFGGVRWSAKAEGEPRLLDVSGWARTEVLTVTSAGGSAIVVARVTHCHTRRGETPLIYWNRTYGAPAPTVA